MDYQVIIHINTKALSFDNPTALFDYVDTQRKQSKVWKTYANYPLLKVIDDQTGEEFDYATFTDLPKETLKSSKVSERSLLIFKNVEGASS